MKRLDTACALALLALAVTGCPAAPGNPPEPALGLQLDRAGRPAVNTLVGLLETDSEQQEADKDEYNATILPEWTTQASKIETTIAPFDGLDAVCGNQLGADLIAGDRYAGLAEMLADDRLWVNSAGTCAGPQPFLSVELNGLAVLSNDACAGRTITADVVDALYSFIADGTGTGIGDGIDTDADCTQSDVDFPFLCDPL